MAATGVQVGDGVFSFFGDDTQLQLVFDQVNKGAKDKVRPASTEVLTLQNRVKALETELGSLQGRVNTLDLAKPARAGNKAFHDTKNTIDLLSNQLGVGLPRELKKFIAEMPGVQSAISGAFKGAAVLALIGFIADLTEKITKFVIDTFIFTEAMKANDKALGETNQRIETQVKKLKDLRDAYVLIGLEGAAKYNAQVAALNRDLGVNNEVLANNKKELEGLNAKYKELSESKAVAVSKALSGIVPGVGQLAKELEQAKFGIERAQAARTEYAANEKVLNAQIAAIQKEGHVAFLKEDAAFREARINGQALVNSSLNKLFFEQERTLIINTGAGYQRMAELERENAKAEIERQIKQQQDLIDTKNPNKASDRAAIVTANAAIANLENQGYADSRKRLNDFREKRNEILGLIIDDQGKVQKVLSEGLDLGLVEKLPNPALLRNVTDELTGVVKQIDLLNTVTDPTSEKIEQVESALRNLGITASHEELTDAAKKAAKAVSILSDAYLDELKVGGELVVNHHDLLEARLASINAQIAATQASDADTASKERHIKSLQAEANAITRQLVPAISTWKKIQREASSDITSAVGAAVSAYASGQATIGEALKGMVQQILSSLASQAIVEAIVQLALGFAALSPTSPDFGHSGEHFTSAAIWGTVGAAAAAAGHALGKQGVQNGPGQTSIGGPIETSPTGAAAPQQSPVTTITRLSGGGLVSRQTLAMLGDDRSGRGNREEAIVPMAEDDKTLDRIAARIHDRLIGEGGGGTVVNNYFKGDLVDYGQVARRLSDGVKDGTYRMTSSTALDTKRRQR